MSRDRKNKKNIAENATKAVAAIKQIGPLVTDQLQELYPDGISVVEVSAVLGGITTDIVANFMRMMPNSTQAEKEDFIARTIKLWGLSLASKIMMPTDTDNGI